MLSRYERKCTWLNKSAATCTEGFIAALHLVNVNAIEYVNKRRVLLHYLFKLVRLTNQVHSARIIFSLIDLKQSLITLTIRDQISNSALTSTECIREQWEYIISNESFQPSPPHPILYRSPSSFYLFPLALHFI